MPIVRIQCSMQKKANIIFRLKCKIRGIFKLNSKSIYDIPIIINNYNRLNYLSQQIEWLNNSGYRNLFIIDNNSNYQPLLSYYKQLPYTIFMLDKNVGHFSLWETILFMRFKDDFYVYTDPDILPINECPRDFLSHFKNVLDRYPDFKKVGFGLKIDDLPQQYILSEKVINWEKQFWMKELENDLYDALIDTTFALYRPGSKGGADGPAIRTSGKYLARHLPWYENSENLDSETEHYTATSSTVSSWYSSLKGQNKQYD